MPRVLTLTFILWATAAVAEEPGLVSQQPSSGRYVQCDRGYMIPYKSKIPGSRVEFEMQPIPGGVFRLGSPAGETGRRRDEGPQVEIRMAPFWMGTYEVTWGEYKRYMATAGLLRELRKENRGALQPLEKVDVFTAPSALYDELIVFQFGEESDRPAIMMKQYAAKQYTKWLSGLTGGFYRLPTECEWEYACRAGATTAYSFGDDPAQLGEYAWFAKNSDEKTQRVGQKRPNPWGLYDMHGNVAEWTSDAYFAEHYGQLAKLPRPSSADATVWPKRIFPCVVRGGSWDDDPAGCRSAARLGSENENWSELDPELPQSPWWFTNGYARGVGFRLIRPLDLPAADQRQLYWSAGNREFEKQVNEHIDNTGRGARGVADENLRRALETAPERKKPE